MNIMRKNRSIFVEVMLVLTFILLLLNIFILVADIKIGINEGIPVISFGKSAGTGGADYTKKETDENLKQYALKLKTYGFTHDAAEAFDKYLGIGSENAESASTYYNVAIDFFDASMYKDALLYLFKAEFSNPSSDLKNKISSKEVICLEKLGRSIDASNLLNQDAVKTKSVKDANLSSEILAIIGNEEITLSGFNKEIQKLPPQIQDTIKNSLEEKKKFLNNMVILKVLYHKAVRLGMDKDPETEAKLNEIKFQMLAQNMLETEIGKTPEPFELDLKNYYEANKDKYKEGEVIKPFEEVKDAVKQAYMFEKKNERMKQVMGELLSVENVKIFENKLS